MTTPDKEEMPIDRTAGPWTTDGRYIRASERGIVSDVIAIVDGRARMTNEANAQFIVTACNAYEPMREALNLSRDALEQARLYIEGDEETHGRQFGDGNAVRSALAKIDAALSTLHVNDRHHSGSDNERLRKALSKIEVWADDRSHLNNVFETIAIEARAALNSTDRQTSDDVGILRKATETLVECLLDVRLIARLDDALEAVPPLDAVCLAKLLRARDAARAALKGVPAPFSGDLFEAHRLADKLLTMAARRSIETQFGWTHPDCVNLQEAARILKNEPQRPQPEYVGAVLSDAPASEAGKLSTDEVGK